ncbi:hypothetical protein, partial [Streptomyces sp. NPDC048202]|uniref:hypothetical protein n=1 Tax=Streptomyces sp. NPDC048202 TaxID=3365514 RepID=UPI003711ED47
RLAENDAPSEDLHDRPPDDVGRMRRAEGTGSTDGPCGAYLVTDTGNAYLPDDPGGFVHENGSRLSMSAGGTSKRGQVDVHEFGRHPRCRPVEHRAARGT